jgi:hypothetical protein
MPTTQFQVDENGLPDFEPVRFYDTPATILTQIWDGEGSLGRAVRTLMKSESLSPAERDSYVQRLKKAYGGNAVLDTTIDVATNPFTWLLVATAPIGVKQFAATRGRLIHGLAEARARGQKLFLKTAELARAAQAANLLNMGETQAPTLLAQAVQSRWDTLSRLEGLVRLRPGGPTVAETRENLMKALGVKDLDYTRHSGEVAARLHEIDLMSNLYATGALAPRREKYPITTTLRAVKVKQVDVDPKTGVRTVAAESKPMLVSEEDYQAFRFPRGVRDGDEITLAGNKYIVDGDSFVQANTAKGFKSVLQMWPKKERAAIKLRATTLDEQKRLHVAGVDQDFFNAWADSLGPGVRQSLVEYLEGGRLLRNEMKKRLFYKTDASGNPLPGSELDVDKLLNVWTKWQRKRGKGENLSVHEEVMDSLLPMEEIDKVLPSWVKEGVRRGSVGVTRERLEREVITKVAPLLEHEYLPRNNYIVYKKTPGGLVPQGPNDADSLVRRRESIVDSRGIANLMLPRRGEGLPYSPDDLRLLADIMRRRGLDPSKARMELPKWQKDDSLTLTEGIERMSKILNSTAETSRGGAVSHALGYEMNMRNYMRDSTGMVILHGSQIPDSMYGLLREALKNRAPLLPGARLGPPMPGTALTEARRRELGLEGITLNPDEEILFGILPEQLLTNPRAGEVRDRLRNLHVQAQDIRTQLAAPGLGAGEKPGLEESLRNLTKRIGGARAELGRIGKREAPPAEVLLSGAKPYMTMDDAIELVMSVESPEVREYFQKIVLPGFFGGSTPTQAFQLRAAQGFRSKATQIVNSGPGKWIERNGGSLGRAVIQNLREYGQMKGYELDAAYAQGGLTGYLYATHLGFNMVSATWNLLQPLQWATTWMGGEHILRGYAQAFKQMGGYLKERITKHGFGRMDPQEKMQLWQKHIRLAGSASGGRDILGMGHDAISMLEGASFMRMPQGKPSLTKWLGIDVPLSIFQTAEAINRITVAEASMGWLSQLQRQSGIRLAANEVLDFAQLFQSMSNFNFNPITQMQAFQKGGVLGNSLLRMFLQYPTRTLSNLVVSNQLGGGTRSFGFSRFGGPSIEIPAPLGDTFRLLGTGAVAYELGKNLLGLDLSSGLAGAAIGQLPNQFLSQGIPIPPVIDIPTQLVAGLAEQDRDQIRQAAFRLLPGGLALQKALGAMPALPGGGSFGLLQSQYADWGAKTPTGQIPVYRNDGSLLAYESPLNLVLRGVGADFKRLKSPEEATKFLLANRAEIINLKRKYKDAVLGNNMALAAQIEGEYKKRFGVPMTVKPSEWDRAVQLREVPLFERMLENLPSDVREPYSTTLDTPQLAARAGLPEGTLSQLDTSRQRQSLRSMASGAEGSS